MLQRLCFTLALFLGAGSAEARTKVGFLGDFVQGLSAPISDGDYKVLADPSYKFGLRFGVVFDIAPKLHIAPEFDFDFIPMNSNDTSFRGADVRLYRVRALWGARFIIPYNFGDVYFRVGFGVDHIGGSSTVNAGPVSATQDLSSTGFTFEPGVGVDFNVVKHLVLGVSTGFPIALHNFNVNGSRSFTSVDADFLATVGVRF